MLIEHQSRRPKIDPSAWIAPTAVLSGDVRVGRDCRVLFGAVLADDGGPIELSDEVIVVENALIRGRVFGLPRDSPALPAAVARRYADWLASHRSDRPVGNQ
jgi:carbonic anhydrase/acetyltransferase-like protein (isoleucine patch superfamily)